MRNFNPSVFFFFFLFFFVVDLGFGLLRLTYTGYDRERVHQQPANSLSFFTFSAAYIFGFLNFS